MRRNSSTRLVVAGGLWLLLHGDGADDDPPLPLTLHSNEGSSLSHPRRRLGW
mgnify:CR=1 FL=1